MKKIIFLFISLFAYTLYPQEWKTLPKDMQCQIALWASCIYSVQALIRSWLQLRLVDKNFKAIIDDPAPWKALFGFCQESFSKWSIITDFKEALMRNKVKWVEAFLRLGLDPNEMFPKGESREQKFIEESIPLQIAAARRSPKIVKLLLEHGAQVNLLRGSRLAGLIEKAKKDPLAFKEIQERLGIEPFIPLDLGFITALPEIPRSSLEDAIRELWARDDIRSEIVKMLLDAGADPNKGYCLHLAVARRGYKNIVKLLLEHGADSNKKLKLGLQETPLHVTVRMQNDDLSVETVKGKNEIIQLLLDYGADINATDANGNTVFAIDTFKGVTKFLEKKLKQQKRKSKAQENEVYKKQRK